MKLSQLKLFILIVLYVNMISFDLAIATNNKHLRKHTNKQQKQSQQKNTNLIKKNSGKNQKAAQQATTAQKDPVKDSLKSIIYNQDTRTPSEVEEYPRGYEVASAFTRSQEAVLFPNQTIYSKDKQTYNMNEATPDNIGDSKILLVHNDTARREQFKDHKFFDKREAFDPIAKNVLGEEFKVATDQIRDYKPPIYKKDQRAYYNPIDEKNIVRQQDNALYVVPINLQQNQLDDDFIKQQVERKRLARKNSYYYDSSALFEPPTHDPIRKALEESAKIQLQPKSVGFNQWINNEKNKKQSIQRLLGSKDKPYFVDQRTNVITNQLKTLDIEADRQKALKNPLPEIKSNSPDYYV